MDIKIIYLVLLTCFSCSAQKQTNLSISVNTIQKIIYIYPTDKQIEKIKKEYTNKEDFYTVADDANYYYYLAVEYLNKNNIHYDPLSCQKYIYLAEQNEKMSIPQNIGFGIFFIYEKNKYKEFVNSIDIGTEWQFIDGHWEKTQ
ncbi:MAG: hypothetical protein LBR17_01150 [Bacteroidales bacterium]|jgi:hypothetical protein|nr:hypothetical protein [Bacteroidales bacterium]